MSAPTLFWFRQDLRLFDNPALTAAAKQGPLVALYIYDESMPWPMGAASKVWLHYSLQSLAADLARHGIKLILRKGDAARLVPKLAREWKIEKLFWNKLYEPAARARDDALEKDLRKIGVTVESHNGSYLFEPHAIKNKSGKPFKVYTPFAKNCLQQSIAPPRKTRLKFISHTAKIKSDSLKDWTLLPTRPDWATSMLKHWTIGEAGAQKQLKRFLSKGLAQYGEGRNRPDKDYVSRLSPYLHFGELSVRQAYHATVIARESSKAYASADIYIKELLWREFSNHVLATFPKLADAPLRPEFEKFPWKKNTRLFTAWKKGQTGFPIVDAGMRQLWQTGWMHNRVRMIVASFMIKNLLQPWQDGEKWFWDTLFDADLGNNAMSWQWVAGCGADASPYFRIFNPVLQGEKFDPEGGYVKAFIPELARLPIKFIHTPWLAPAKILDDAKIRLGDTYPMPIVDLAKSRDAALRSFKQIK